MVRSAWPVALALAACHFTPGGAPGDGSRPTTDAAVDGLPDTCTPSEVACDGRVRRVCGADGAWDPAQDTTCDFTCAGGSCVVASNVPAADVSTCGSTAPRLTPASGTKVIVTAANGIHLECSPDCGDPGVTQIPAQATLATTTPSLAWFCLSRISIPAGVTLGLPPTGGPAAAIALVVDGPVAIDGTIDFDGFAATSAVPGGEGAPGGFDGADLSGGAGNTGHGPCGGGGGQNKGSSSHWVGGGGGGGGYASAGGGGGTGRCTNNDHTASGASGGSMCGTSALIPLVGGSGGGGGGDATTGVSLGWAGGGGGGALQISSRISIAIGGTVSARGGAGYGVSGIDGGGGGGAGGGLLLEAPAVAITGTATVDGGAGGESGAGAGGAGATGSAGPVDGLSFSATGQGGSGGGGAGGRIRINAEGASCPATVSPIASCSTGALATP